MMSRLRRSRNAPTAQFNLQVDVYHNGKFADDAKAAINARRNPMHQRRNSILAWGNAPGNVDSHQPECANGRDIN